MKKLIRFVILVISMIILTGINISYVTETTIGEKIYIVAPHNKRSLECGKTLQLYVGLIGIMVFFAIKLKNIV